MVATPGQGEFTLLTWLKLTGDRDEARFLKRLFSEDGGRKEGRAIFSSLKLRLLLANREIAGFINDVGPTDKKQKMLKLIKIN